MFKRWILTSVKTSALFSMGADRLWVFFFAQMSTHIPEKQAPGISFYSNTMFNAFTLSRYENRSTNTVNLNTEKQSDIIFYLDCLVSFYKYYRGSGNC